MPPTLLTPSPSIPTLGELLRRLGDIPADRVRYFPPPGTATEQDVLDIRDREGVLCELVDGVLVEKPMGFYESLLAIYLATELNNFVLPRNLGFVTGEAGMMRLFFGRVRMPDVAFFERARLPGGRPPPGPIPEIYPDIAIEVLSASNTVREIEQKRREYFDSGTRLVWIVELPTRTVSVFTAANPQEPTVLQSADKLTGGDVLPGFTMELSRMFALLNE